MLTHSNHGGEMPAYCLSKLLIYKFVLPIKW